jgi:hypothetical protein
MDCHPQFPSVPFSGFWSLTVAKFSPLLQSLASGFCFNLSLDRRSIAVSCSSPYGFLCAPWGFAQLGCLFRVRANCVLFSVENSFIRFDHCIMAVTIVLGSQWGDEGGLYMAREDT